MRTFILAAALLLVGAASAVAAPAPAPSAAPQKSPEALQIDEAWHFIESKQPAQAVEILDRVIAAEEKAHAGDRRLIFCANTMAESVLYAGLGAKEKRDTMVLGPEWAMAIFLKGFAYIDLNRSDEAKPLFDRALVLSPMNAQFLGETGEWYKSRHQWDQAFDYFKRAADNAFLMQDEKFHKRRGLRGMGFVLVEQGKLDEAERLYRQCLEIDPDDASAKQELEYISEQRAKLRGATT